MVFPGYICVFDSLITVDFFFKADVCVGRYEASALGTCFDERKIERMLYRFTLTVLVNHIPFRCTHCHVRPGVCVCMGALWNNVEESAHRGL